VARSLDQILAELNPSYSSSENILNTRLNAIPGEIEAGVQQADAKLGQANTNILNSARRRGTGVAFGGIPLGEQAQYAATEYAPAIANLKATGANKELSLQESLASLNREKRSQAQSIYDTDLSRDFQERQFQESIRQFNEQQAAQARAAADAARQYNFGGGGGGGNPTGATPGAARIDKNANGGFNFFDGTGKAINAAQYSQLTGRGYREVLTQLAKDGDQNAKIALQYVGNDAKFGNAPANVKAALTAVGATGTYANNAQRGTQIVTNNQGIRVPTF
jgi:hypothetical protein